MGVSFPHVLSSIKLLHFVLWSEILLEQKHWLARLQYLLWIN